MAMHNARRGGLPLVLMAGKAPYTVRGELPGSRDNYVHFIQSRSTKPGSCALRQVGMDAALGVMTKETLRARTPWRTAIPWPGLPYAAARDVDTDLDEARCARSLGSATRACPPARPMRRPSAQIADKLLSAKHPVMYLYAGASSRRRADRGDRAHGRHPRIRGGPLYLNISRASPCFAGMMPAIAEADVGLLVDVDVPWIPKHTKENPQTWWAHIDVDVVKECFPIWVSPRTRACRATAC